MLSNKSGDPFPARGIHVDTQALRRPASEITPQESYTQFLSRRRFLRNAIAGGITSGAVLAGADRLADVFSPPTHALADETRLQTVKSPLTTTGEQLTSFAGHHPLQQLLRVWRARKTIQQKRRRPAHASVDSENGRQGETAENLRHRCAAETASSRRPRLSPSLVEAWSMVIPWIGYSLSEFIKQCDPLPSAKYVQFLSLLRQARREVGV